MLFDSERVGSAGLLVRSSCRCLSITISGGGPWSLQLRYPDGLQGDGETGILGGSSINLCGSEREYGRQSSR